MSNTTSTSTLPDGTSSASSMQTLKQSNTTSPAGTGYRKGVSKPIPHEDLLLRSWRSTAHGVALVTAKAERVVAVASTPDSHSVSNDSAMKDLNDATIGFLRNHLEWGRSISYIEAKLEGKAAEMEALQHYLRSHPSMGRKRKRTDGAAKR